MEMFPDPEKARKALFRLKRAVQAAAEKSEGPARPLFGDLSRAVDTAVDDGLRLAARRPDMGLEEILRELAPVLMDIQVTVMDLQHFARTDAAAARTLKELETVFREEVRNLMSVEAAPANIPPPQKTPKSPKYHP